jgi:RND family efflux transporter MFP subunit
MSKPKKYTIWIIILLAIGTGVYYFIQSGKPATTYTTENAVRGDLVQTVTASGTVRAENEANLSFQGNGQITQMLFGVGDQIKKGQKMAEIDKGTLYIELKQAREDVKAQKETLENMKDNEDVYSRDQRDAQRAIIRKYEEQINAVLHAIYETVMYAPISGTVIAKNYELGENVMANATIYAIAGEGGLEIEADVPESDIVKVKVGQGATISLDAFPSDEKLEAEVTEIEPASTVIQDVVYYKTKLKFANTDERIKNGMSADADIKTAEKKNVVIIPLRAVKTEGDREYVEVLKIQDKKEVTEKVFVKTGLRGDDGMVEIMSGLSGGEKVVTLTKAL